MLWRFGREFFNRFVNPKENLIVRLHGQIDLFQVDSLQPAAVTHPFPPARPLDDDPWLFAACRILSVFLGLNVLLAVLNLYPIPPLDGAAVLEGLFPRLGVVYDFIRGQPFLLIACIAVVWYTMDGFIWPVLGEIVSWL